MARTDVMPPGSRSEKLGRPVRGAFGAGTALYMLLGSWHEERRLMAAYGQRFVQYRQEVPHLLLPVVRPGGPRRSNAPIAPAANLAR